MSNGEIPPQAAEGAGAEAPADAAGAEQETGPRASKQPAAPDDDVPKASDIFTLARQQQFKLAEKLLTSYPQYWTERDDDGHTFLHWAALVGCKDFVLTLLAKGVPVDALANNKQTSLMWAVLRGHILTARMLVEAKASLTVHDSLGATPLMIALQHRKYSAFLLLMQRGGDSLLSAQDKNGCTAAHWAAYKGDETALRLLAYFGADLLALDNSKMMPIHRACCASQISVITFLVENKSNPNVPNAEGKTCLDIATKSGDVGLQKLLKQVMRAGGLDDVDDLVASIEEDRAIKDDAGKKKKKGGGMQAMMKDRALQKAFPVFWLVCVSLAIFQYLTDLHPVSAKLAPTITLLFEISVPLSVLLFAYTALSDPGILPAQSRGNSGVEQIMRALDKYDGKGKAPDISRLCLSTWVLKDLRTKYCVQTRACVSEFDHYCVWLNCAIGRGNHRQFCVLAMVEEFAQLCHIYLMFTIAFELVPYQSFGAWLFGLCSSYPLLVLMFFGHCLTAPWVLMLNLHQGRLISQNLTTNEMLNWRRYEHFWKDEFMLGRMHKVFRNPFHKGSVIKNSVDFWWARKRSQVSENVDLDSKGAGHGHSHRHGHSHGNGRVCNHAHGHAHDHVPEP